MLPSRIILNTESYSALWDNEKYESLEISDYAKKLQSKEFSTKTLLLKGVIYVLNKISTRVSFHVNYLGKNYSYDAFYKQLISLSLLDKLNPIPWPHDTPRIYTTAATIDINKNQNATEGAVHEGNILYGFGFGWNKVDARNRAIGEMIERFYTGKYQVGLLLRKSVNEMRKIYGSNNIYDVTSDKKRKHEISDRNKSETDVDDAQLYWVKGINESTGSTCHIPAQCIFWNYINTAKKHTEPVLGDINTSGAAAHVTIEKWKKSALFELIERDGFITCWLKKIPPTRIDVFTVTSEQIKNYIAQLHGSGFKIYLLNTTSTLRIPSVTAVLIDPTNIGPYVTVAAAAAENFEKAIEKAIGEVMGSYALIRSKDWQKLYVTYDLGNKAFKEFDQGDRLIWWANKKNASNIDYFLSGAVTPIREAESGAYCPESYAELLKHCSSNGYRVYSYTVSDLRLEKIGFKVGKLISPDFNNLYLDEVNKTQSIVTLDIDINCLNDVPHPFP